MLRLPNEKLSTNLKELLEFLPINQKNKLYGFHFIKDAKLFLCGQLLVRAIISKYLNINNTDQHFVLNEYGKPYIYGVENFHYNLSHSGNWVVCAIDQKPVGVDIEKIKPFAPDIARYYFSAEEFLYMSQAPETVKLGLFYELWTFKESYIKALGCGLSKPLNSFTIKLVGDGKARVKDANPKVFFRQYKLNPGYKLATCCFQNEYDELIKIVDLNWIEARLNE